MTQKFVAFDTETTGLDRGSRLVELAAVLFDEAGNVLEACEWMVNPGMPMPADTSEFNGITDTMLASARNAGAVLSDFFRWVPEDAILLAHYAQFDTGIVSWEAGRFGVPIPDLKVIDTCAIAKALGVTRRNGLEVLIEHYGIRRKDSAHRAPSDADACMQYFNAVRGVEHAGITTPLDAAVPWAQAGHDYSYPAELPPVLRGLPGLVERGADFAFKYTDAKGDTTERVITPYGWAQVGDSIMFHGWCKLRNERRTFRADRIQAAGPA